MVRAVCGLCCFARSADKHLLVPIAAVNWAGRGRHQHFQAASQKLVAQYSAYKPFPDLAINGQQTLSENLADLAGLAAAYDAYHVSLKGKPAVADADKQFFMGYAQSWINAADSDRCCVAVERWPDITLNCSAI